MKTPHKHAALIKQWADGAIIECFDEGEWTQLNNPVWCHHTQYRVKPEPKTDVVRYACLDIDCKNKVTARSNFFSVAALRGDNLKVVFDGETGELKDAQVLANV